MYRIILEGQPAQAVRHQIAELIGDDQMVARGESVEIVLPDQSSVARVISQLTELGCRIAAVAQA